MGKNKADLPAGWYFILFLLLLLIGPTSAEMMDEITKRMQEIARVSACPTREGMESRGGMGRMVLSLRESQILMGAFITIIGAYWVIPCLLPLLTRVLNTVTDWHGSKNDF